MSIHAISIQPTIISTENKPVDLQGQFMQAIQDWDLNKVLEVLKTGTINPHEIICEMSETLANKLSEINETLNIIEPDEIEDGVFETLDITDVEMPAWMLLSLFTTNMPEQGLRQEIMEHISPMLDQSMEVAINYYKDLIREEFELYAEGLSEEEIQLNCDFMRICYQYNIEKWKADNNFDFDLDEADMEEIANRYNQLHHSHLAEEIATLINLEEVKC